MIRVGYPSVLADELVRAELLGPLEGSIELVPLDWQRTTPAEVEVWIPDPDPVKGAALWPQLRGVRLVITMTAGTEWLPELVGPEVPICNARGAHDIPTAEWVVTALLALLKFFPYYYGQQQQGRWPPRSEAARLYGELSGDHRLFFPPPQLEELHERRVLLIGYGSIGQQIERLLTPFAPRLTRVARSARSEPKVHAVSELNQLLPEAEAVILILPLTPESHHLFSRRQFELLPHGAILVNAARGPVVDTDALVAALHTGRLRAALDVTDPEPLPEGHPLWKCPNLLIAPHVAGTTVHSGARALRLAAGEIDRYLRHLPHHNLVRADL